MPQRIQRKRTPGWRMPEGAVYVGRPTKYGNRFRIGDKNDNGEVVTAEMAVDYYEFDLKRKYPGAALQEFLTPLRDKDLVCWCPLDRPCHGDPLLRLANS